MNRRELWTNAEHINIKLSFKPRWLWQKVLDLPECLLGQGKYAFAELEKVRRKGSKGLKDGGNWKCFDEKQQDNETVTELA